MNIYENECEHDPEIDPTFDTFRKVVLRKIDFSPYGHRDLISRWCLVENQNLLEKLPQGPMRCVLYAQLGPRARFPPCFRQYHS